MCPMFPQQPLNHRMIRIALEVSVKVEELAGSVQQALPGQAVDQWADGRQHDIGQESLGRRHNGVTLVLAYAEEGSLLRAWDQAENLGEQLSGGFLRICDLGEEGTEGIKIGPVTVQGRPDAVADRGHLGGRRSLRWGGIPEVWRFPALLHRISSPTRMKRSEAIPIPSQGGLTVAIR